jgi:hypothetical protein
MSCHGNGSQAGVKLVGSTCRVPSIGTSLDETTHTEVETPSVAARLLFVERPAGLHRCAAG